MLLSLGHAVPIIDLAMPRTASRKSRERHVSPGEQSVVGTVGPRGRVILDEVLTSAVKLACDILKADDGAIALADEKGILTLRTQFRLTTGFVKRWKMKSSEGLAGIVFRTGEPYACRDVREDESFDGTAVKLEELRALLVAPLKSDGKVIGCLYVSHRKPHDFSAEEVRLASLFADYVSMSIESATLLKKERHQRQRSEALLDVVSATTLSLSLKQILVKLCQSVLKLTVAERCSMFLFNEDTHTLEPIMSLMALGAEDPALWEEMRASAGLKIPEIGGTGEAIEAQGPIVVEDAPGSAVIPSFWVETFGIKSAALYPLVHREKTIGMMVVDSFTKFIHFSAEEIETLDAIAKHAAVMIENARLYEKEQGQRQRSEALVDVLTAAASSLSQKKVLITLCEAVVDISVGERCSIFLLDSERGRLEPVMSLGARDEKLWQKFRRPPARVRREPEEQRFLQAATTWDKPIVVEDAANSPILPRWWVKTFSLKSLVQYPLRVKDRTIGAMTVHTSRDRVHFPQEEIDTLAAVAKQAAVIIENARLYEQERQQRQRAEALVNVLSAAGSDVSFRKVLAAISQAVVDFSVGERCSIFLFNEETHTLDPVMAMGPGDPSLFEKWRASAGLKISEIRGIGEAIKTQEPVIEEHAPGSGAIPSHWIKAFRLKSVALYPLVHREKTVGILVVNTFTHFTHFPQDEIETLAAVARQAAIIIENARLHDKLREQAITDHLTGLFNHRHIHERLEEEFARAARNNRPFGVMMMDLDNFKFFNDAHGHLKGDEALKHVGGVLRDALRTTDIVGRYGGDEFLAILPETTREEAEKAGSRILEALAERPFTFEEHETLLGMSIGIACYPYDSGIKQELLTLADAALYEAKRLGAGRVVPANVSELEFVPARSLGFGLLQGLLNALAHKDPYTKRHCEDNVRYVDRLAERLHLSETATESLRKAALLHDVGKIAIPDSTLMKPGPLDSEEWEVMQQHVRFGEMIVKGIAQIADAIEPVATHHERFDGKGYPRGLKGKDIPLLGRILAVVDAYSAMTLDRPYRNALSKEVAIQELRSGAGTQFDPAVVAAFLATIETGEEPRTKVA